MSAVSTTSIDHAHDQASAKVVAMSEYQRRLRIQCGGGVNHFIMYVLIEQEVIPQHLVCPGVIRGPEGRPGATLYLVCRAI